MHWRRARHRACDRDDRVVREVAGKQHAPAATILERRRTCRSPRFTSTKANTTKLGADCSALVYYTAAPDGFHVVVTTQHSLTDEAAVERFETVLAAGQSAAVSIPRAAGEAPARIVLSNAGSRLHIAEPPASVAAQ